MKNFLNQTLDKKGTKKIITWFLNSFGPTKTSLFLEELKSVGFHQATISGLSLGFDDLKIPSGKEKLLETAEISVLDFEKKFQKGKITAVERYQKLLDIWTTASETLKDSVIQNFQKLDILNPLYMMAFSGARGNISQVRQLVGMRGLMSDSAGGIIDFPIRRNFREGLTVTEYAISCYGARKGLIDTALRTADSGYLTRRLVDVAHGILIGQIDCKTQEGFDMYPLSTTGKSGTESIVLSLEKRIIGRILSKPELGSESHHFADVGQVSANTAEHIGNRSESKSEPTNLSCVDRDQIMAKPSYTVSATANRMAIEITPLIAEILVLKAKKQKKYTIRVRSPLTCGGAVDVQGVGFADQGATKDLGSLSTHVLQKSKPPVEVLRDAGTKFQKASLHFAGLGRVGLRPSVAGGDQPYDTGRSLPAEGGRNQRSEETCGQRLDPGIVTEHHTKPRVMDESMRVSRLNHHFADVGVPFGTCHSLPKAIRSEAKHRVQSLSSSSSKRDIDRNPENICQLCYGWSLAHARLVSLGDAVGVLAAQSIGEPGTQLTMRTFHTGGIFSTELEAKIFAPQEGYIGFSKTRPKGKKIRTFHGQTAFFTFEAIQLKIYDSLPQSPGLPISGRSPLLFAEGEKQISPNTFGNQPRGQGPPNGYSITNIAQESRGCGTTLAQDLSAAFGDEWPRPTPANARVARPLKAGDSKSSIFYLPKHSLIFVSAGQKVFKQSLCAEISHVVGAKQNSHTAALESPPLQLGPRLRSAGGLLERQKELRDSQGHNTSSSLSLSYLHSGLAKQEVAPSIMPASKGASYEVSVDSTLQTRQSDNEKSINKDLAFEFLTETLYKGSLLPSIPCVMQKGEALPTLSDQHSVGRVGLRPFVAEGDQPSAADSGQHSTETKAYLDKVTSVSSKESGAARPLKAGVLEDTWYAPPCWPQAIRHQVWPGLRPILEKNAKTDQSFSQSRPLALVSNPSKKVLSDIEGQVYFSNPRQQQVYRYSEVDGVTGHANVDAPKGNLNHSSPKAPSSEAKVASPTENLTSLLILNGKGLSTYPFFSSGDFFHNRKKVKGKLRFTSFREVMVKGPDTYSKKRTRSLGFPAGGEVNKGVLSRNALQSFHLECKARDNFTKNESSSKRTSGANAADTKYKLEWTSLGTSPASKKVLSSYSMIRPAQRGPRLVSTRPVLHNPNSLHLPSATLLGFTEVGSTGIAFERPTLPVNSTPLHRNWIFGVWVTSFSGLLFSSLIDPPKAGRKGLRGPTQPKKLNKDRTYDASLHFAGVGLRPFVAGGDQPYDTGRSLPAEGGRNLRSDGSQGKATIASLGASLQAGCQVIRWPRACVRTGRLGYGPLEFYIWLQKLKSISLNDGSVSLIWQIPLASKTLEGWAWSVLNKTNSSAHGRGDSKTKISGYSVTSGSFRRNLVPLIGRPIRSQKEPITQAYLSNFSKIFKGNRFRIPTARPARYSYKDYRLPRLSLLQNRYCVRELRPSKTKLRNIRLGQTDSHQGTCPCLYRPAQPCFGEQLTTRSQLPVFARYRAEASYAVSSNRESLCAPMLPYKIGYTPHIKINASCGIAILRLIRNNWGCSGTRPLMANPGQVFSNQLILSHGEAISAQFVTSHSVKRYESTQFSSANTIISQVAIGRSLPAKTPMKRRKSCFAVAPLNPQYLAKLDQVPHQYSKSTTSSLTNPIFSFKILRSWTFKSSKTKGFPLSPKRVVKGYSPIARSYKHQDSQAAHSITSRGIPWSVTGQNQLLPSLLYPTPAYPSVVGVPFEAGHSLPKAIRSEAKLVLADSSRVLSGEFRDLLVPPLREAKRSENSNNQITSDREEGLLCRPQNQIQGLLLQAQHQRKFPWTQNIKKNKMILGTCWFPVENAKKVSSSFKADPLNGYSLTTRSHCDEWRRLASRQGRHSILVTSHSSAKPAKGMLRRVGLRPTPANARGAHVVEHISNRFDANAAKKTAAGQSSSQSEPGGVASSEPVERHSGLVQEAYDFPNNVNTSSYILSKFLVRKVALSKHKINYHHFAKPVCSDVLAESHSPPKAASEAKHRVHFAKRSPGSEGSAKPRGWASPDTESEVSGEARPLKAGIKATPITSPTSPISRLRGRWQGLAFGQSSAIRRQRRQVPYPEANLQIVLRKFQSYTFSSHSPLFVKHGDIVLPRQCLFELIYQQSKTGDIVQGLPKIEELFEARRTSAHVIESIHSRLKQKFDELCLILPLYEATKQSIRFIQRILVDEIQLVYQSQGVEIGDKHIEIIVRQMTSKVLIHETGKTSFFPDDIINFYRLPAASSIPASSFGIVEGKFDSYQSSEFQSRVAQTITSQPVKRSKQKPRQALFLYEPIVLGITKIAFFTESFVSAASFQEAKKVLMQCALESRVDFLHGLKENVILGRFIQAGTGSQQS